MSKKLSQMQKDTIKELDEIWEFYEGEKLTQIEFLHEDYYRFHEEKRKKERHEEADEAEMDLDSKRVFLKLAKKMIRKSE